MTQVAEDALAKLESADPDDIYERRKPLSEGAERYICDYSWTLPSTPCHVTRVPRYHKKQKSDPRRLPYRSCIDATNVKKCSTNHRTSFRKWPFITLGASPSHPENPPWSPMALMTQQNKMISQWSPTNVNNKTIMLNIILSEILEVLMNNQWISMDHSQVIHRYLWITHT